MSFETNDMNPIINRDNYEEYFLMYVDDELTPQERRLVDVFLQCNPELQAELDALMGAKLEPEVLSFDDKESLLAESMEQNLVDESLLLHVDNELPEDERKKVALRLQLDKAYNTQYQWLLRTKSNPAEVVPCPNKEALYRHAVRRIGFAPALRVAAAVLLIGSLGLVWWMQDNGETAAPAVAVNAPKNAQPVTSSATPDVAKQKDEQPAVQEQHKVDVQRVATETPQLAQVPAIKKIEAARKEISKSQPAVKQVPVQEPQAQDQLAFEQPAVPQRSHDALVAQAVPAPEKEITTDVTYRAPDAYNTTEARFASSNDDDDRGGRNNLKSLLRKATRIVERRTSINATNDEDELIIGAVAIKLK